MRRLYNKFSERKMKKSYIERFDKQMGRVRIYLIVSIIDVLAFLGFCHHSQRYHLRARANVRINTRRQS